MSDAAKLFREIPAMDTTLHTLAEQHASLFTSLPRPLVRRLAEEFFNGCRDKIRQGAVTRPQELSLAALLPALAEYIARKGRPRFRRVINGTGVVIHTNLGRSLLADEAVAAVSSAAAHYSNLEFDLRTGERGSRYSHVEELICQLTGAEAALVVNNNAAAVMLVLDTMAKGKEVIVSRGELVEIGGSFRIPEVMEKSGCILREVGATNRTHPNDYAAAITENTAALMKVHTSNYRIIGFHSEVELSQLAELARPHGLPVIHDLGSGNLFDFAAAGFPLLAEEPTVKQMVKDGADIVTFSGDKILGGPQAGVIVGTKKTIAPIKRNPMNRALRIDKMTLAAMEATLRLYLDPELAARKIPTLQMLLMSADLLRQRAHRLVRLLRISLAEHARFEVIPGVSRVGGGSLPEKDLPTSLVGIRAGQHSSDALRDLLLAGELPVVGRIDNDAFCLDVRTLADADFSLVRDALLTVLAPR